MTRQQQLDLRKQRRKWSARMMFRRRWVLQNRGILSEVADELGLSKAFVSQVIYGERVSEGGRVEAKLREKGAPL